MTPGWEGRADAAWEGSAFAESGLAGAGEVRGMWAGGAGGAGTTLLPFSPPSLPTPPPSLLLPLPPPPPVPTPPFPPPAGTIARGLSAAALRAWRPCTGSLVSFSWFSLCVNCQAMRLTFVTCVHARAQGCQTRSQTACMRERAHTNTLMHEYLLQKICM
jgi:hypothetical protein